jgi:hypothetical protein
MLAAMVSGLISGVGSDTELVEWLHGLPIDFCHKLGFTRQPPKLDCFRDLLIGVLSPRSLRDRFAGEGELPGG